jgi:3-(3-hydroxy-phenyl)propionate hydroxylase
MTDHAVLIVGSGPTGMMLAAELALADVDVAIIERRASSDLDGSRAGGLHARSLEVLDQRGVADRFISQGLKYPVVHAHPVALSTSDFPTRHNYTLALFQKHIERIMAEWIAELKVPVYREREVTGYWQDDAGVDVGTSDGQSRRARYLVGCDGGRSVIRKTAGIDFPGWEASRSWLIAEAQFSDEPAWGMRHDDVGLHGIGKLEDGRGRIVLTEMQLRTDSEPTLRDISEGLIRVYGTDYGIHTPSWISSFNDMARQAAAYRDRRVLLAGDAAHVHAPIGGQGLNVGVQDAVNLGWKLAQVVKQMSPATLLDTYHAERHPVAARVLRNTMAQVALSRTDARSKAMCQVFSEIVSADEARRQFGAMMTGLDIHYDFCEGHPLLGRRMPDLDLVTAAGPQRVFTLLHRARPALINFGEPGKFDITQWADRIQSIDARYDGPWELPGLGAVTAPTAVLIRPDGYVAWTGDQTQTGLTDALTTWFGAPA